ncbi:hypothetical protein K432DRAFT_442276 [Lepidopterella palustris CBS 459.81]|uniref:Uncharacterized protein n=1 Tax=Lepidopterella palustris CBS 459.81 TaxID=1314670 RepID=A0A8E2ECR7_9PEZI|nr:hypothetical protein K432DRAFT_442276 [Lepidopterella palustris CBS 459.81]
MRSSVNIFGALIRLAAYHGASALSSEMWCGKALNTDNPSAASIPGGKLLAPRESCSTPLLDLRVYPRYSIYTTDDQVTTLVVDAERSCTHGQPIYGPGRPGSHWTTLSIQITSALTGNVLVPWTGITVGSKGNEFNVSMDKFDSIKVPYVIRIYGSSPNGAQVFQSTSNLNIIESRSVSGSIVRIDQIPGGGLQVLRKRKLIRHHPRDISRNNRKTGDKGPKRVFNASVDWETVPAEIERVFHANLDWFEESVMHPNDERSLKLIKARGFDIIHPIPNADTYTFNATSFGMLLAEADKAGLFVVLDMRGTYQDLDLVTDQIATVSGHPSFLLYVTADKPDGAYVPVSLTSRTYNHIKQLDPYHPIAVSLACSNFYFKQYSAGADIILEDVSTVPGNANVSINHAHSHNRLEPRDANLIPCGCVSPEVVSRAKDYLKFQEWIGLTKATLQGRGFKPIWVVSETYDDSGDNWSPTHGLR